MDVVLHDPSDLTWLAERIEAEKDARQRDRYRVAELALSGMQTEEIAQAVRPAELIARNNPALDRFAFTGGDLKASIIAELSSNSVGLNKLELARRCGASRPRLDKRCTSSPGAVKSKCTSKASHSIFG